MAHQGSGWCFDWLLLPSCCSSSLSIVVSKKAAWGPLAQSNGTHNGILKPYLVEIRVALIEPPRGSKRRLDADALKLNQHNAAIGAQLTPDDNSRSPPRPGTLHRQINFPLQHAASGTGGSRKVRGERLSSSNSLNALVFPISCKLFPRHLSCFHFFMHCSLDT
jgi:hypothetical protein